MGKGFTLALVESVTQNQLIKKKLQLETSELHYSARGERVLVRQSHPQTRGPISPETIRSCSFIVGNTLIVSSLAALVVALVSMVMQMMEMEPLVLCHCGNFFLFHASVESVIPVHPTAQHGLGKVTRHGMKLSLKHKRLSEINKTLSHISCCLKCSNIFYVSDTAIRILCLTEI